MIKAIIFDLDGTLVDTIESIRAAINNTLRHYSFPEKSYEDIRKAIGNGARNLILRVIPEAESGNERLIGEILNHYNGEYETTFRMADSCYPGMHEAVEVLSRRRYKIAILSNKPDRFVKEMADILFPGGEILCARGQSSLPIKPDPTSALQVARILGEPPESCAFVGDSDVDVMTAKNAGMRSVGVSWGYRGAEVLRKSGADVIIDRPEELLTLFR